MLLGRLFIMNSSDEPSSLRALYEAAEAKREALESTSALHPSYATTLNEALALYARASDQISAVSLFSSNEGVEDISTNDIPYLLVNFYIAETVQKTPELRPAARLPILERARAAYERFLNTLDEYSLVNDAPYKEMLERYRDDPKAFALVASSDPARKRDGKMANFRAEKQLKDKLALLKRNPRYLEHGDEELVREVYLTIVRFAVHSTFQALDSLNRETTLLEGAPREVESGRAANDPNARPSENEFDPTLRLDAPLSTLQNGGPLLSQQGKPLQPFTLFNSRDERARAVFRPGHNLPTMSIDEYLDEERRRGGIIEGGGEQPAKQVDEDDMDAADRETYKARQWDDFTDDNPKGSGNTLNRG